MSTQQVLLVDDDDTFIRSLCCLLEEEGISVKCAKDGIEALEMMEQARHKGSPFAIVVSDVTMPRMGGYTLLAEVKKLNPKLPFVIITAYSHLAPQTTGSPVEPEEFIEKPFDHSALTAVLRRLAPSVFAT